MQEIILSDCRGRLHGISFQGDTPSLSSYTKPCFRGKAHSFDDLSPQNKRVVAEVSALLDDHYVSDVFWEELSHSLWNLPPLRFFRSYREAIDNTTEVLCIPGSSRGAQVSFVAELTKAILDLSKEKKTRD